MLKKITYFYVQDIIMVKLFQYLNIKMKIELSKQKYNTHSNEICLYIQLESKKNNFFTQ